MSGEDHSGMRLAQLETGDRGDVWIYVTFDAGRPINAAGFWPDEHGAFLASEEENRRVVAAGDDPFEHQAIPLFIDRRQVDG